MHRETEAPLHLAVSILIGVAYGSALSIVFGVVAGVAVAVLANRGPLGFLGPYPELAVVMLPMWSLPSGILGGLVCGMVRGERFLSACLMACATAVLVTMTGLQGAEPLGLATFGGFFVLVALSSTAVCCLLVRRISRKREAVVRAMREDPTAFPGKPYSMVIAVSAIVMIAGLITSGLFLVGRSSDFLLGLIAGAGLLNTLCGLQLVGIYPNRAYLNWALTILSFLVALSAGIVVAFRPVLP